jgi:hypothetical protein
MVMTGKEKQRLPCHQMSAVMDAPGELSASEATNCFSSSESQAAKMSSTSQKKTPLRPPKRNGLGIDIPGKSCALFIMMEARVA